MTKDKIAAEARQATLQLQDKAPNPYPLNSFEHRFWQDGVRMGMDEVYEAQGLL